MTLKAVIAVFLSAVSEALAFQSPTVLRPHRERIGWSMCAAQTSVSTAATQSRRLFLERAAFAAVALPQLASAEEVAQVDAEKRGSQRPGGNAIAPQDFAFFRGKYLPRVLDFENLPKQEDNKAIYNAWGACIDNSCSYVPLKQRYDGYKKYKDSTALAASILSGSLLQSAAGTAGFNSEDGKLFEKALRRGVLFANLLLISENYGTSNEALAARYYVNEAFFAMQQLQKEAQRGELSKSKEWWLLCRDSWNSYLTLVNRAIVPKVGDKFPLVSSAP